MSKFAGFESPNFTQTPNDFFDEILLSKDITLAEVKILGFVIRYTYGWQRAGNSLQFTFTELQKACRLGREAVNNGLKKLLKKNYIQRKEIDGHMKYRLHIKEFSDYPWSVEFNWKNVFIDNEKEAETFDTQGGFGNRTSLNSESVGPQESQDSLNKVLNKDLNKKEEEESELVKFLIDKDITKENALKFESKLLEKGITSYTYDDVMKAIELSLDDFMEGHCNEPYIWAAGKLERILDSKNKRITSKKSNQFAKFMKQNKEIIPDWFVELKEKEKEEKEQQKNTAVEDKPAFNLDEEIAKLQDLLSKRKPQHGVY